MMKALGLEYSTNLHQAEQMYLGMTLMKLLTEHAADSVSRLANISIHRETRCMDCVSSTKI